MERLSVCWTITVCAWIGVKAQRTEELEEWPKLCVDLGRYVHTVDGEEGGIKKRGDVR